MVMQMHRIQEHQEGCIVQRVQAKVHILVSDEVQTQVPLGERLTQAGLYDKP